MKKRIWIVAVVAVGVVGVGAYFARTRTQPPPAITTVAVTRGDVVETVDATGTLQAVTTVQVGTQVSGTIKALHADFNTTVRRGQTVAELEPSLFDTQVEQARASLARLEADVGRAHVQLEDADQKRKRARELARAELIAASELETAEVNTRVAEAALRAAQAQVVQAQASLHQSEVNLAHTIIKAPIDGVVISRNVDVGQTVAASMQAPTLFVIARDLREMQVEARIAESDIGRVRTGQVAAVSLIVGGIGIMNIMLVSVTERTHEIGLRLSVGARDVDVLLQFLVEAIVLSVVGGVIGILVGVAAARIVAETMNWSTAVTSDAVLLAFGFAAGVGVFFGFYPARKAAGLNPIDALRYE